MTELGYIKNSDKNSISNSVYFTRTQYETYYLYIQVDSRRLMLRINQLSKQQHFGIPESNYCGRRFL